MKKLLFSLLIMIIIFYSFSFAALEVNSPYLTLIDASNNRVLFERDGYIKTYPASTTKIMTAILTLENAKLDDMVTASENAINLVPSGGSTANIVAGETLSVEDLLRALLLVSGNEAANILAEHVSGSIDAFAEKMNQRAIELGCKNTHFVNPNGLHDDNHYSCAYDISIIYSYAYNNFPDFRRISSMVSFKLPVTEIYPKDDRTFKNTNKLMIPSKTSDGHLYYYEYCVGGKTGYTSQAKNCLVSISTKDGVTLVATVLGAIQSPENLSYRYQDSINLFNYGFERVVRKAVIPSGEVVTSVEVLNSKTPKIPLEVVTASDVIANVDTYYNEEETGVTINISGDIKAPIMAYQELGSVTYTIYGEEYTVPLLAKTEVEAKPVFSLLDLLSAIIKWGLRLALVLIIIIIVLKILGVGKGKKARSQRIARTRKYNQRFRR